MYISENYGTGKNDEKRAENMLQRFKESQNDLEKEGLDAMLQEEAKQQQNQDISELEEILKDQKLNSEITKTYKLFNLMCK